jgi:hypothetical protein
MESPGGIRTRLLRLDGSLDHSIPTFAEQLVGFDNLVEAEPAATGPRVQGRSEDGTTHLHKGGNRIARKRTPRAHRLSDSDSEVAIVRRLPTLEVLMRYETCFERNIERTLNQLERQQRLRRGDPVPPPVKLGVSS